MLTRLSPWVDKLAVRRRLIYVLARIFVVLFAANFVVEHGTWTMSQVFHGPFERSAGDTAKYTMPIGTVVPFLSIPSPRPERELAPDDEQPLKLWINGSSWNPPEALEASIDQGKVWGMRGLYRTLQFALPEGVANEASTSLKIQYQIRMHRTIYDLILYCAGALLIVATMIAYRMGDCIWVRRFSSYADLLIPLMRLASWALVVACVLYAGTIIYGLVIGDLLPTATVFRLLPASRLVTDAAPFAPLGLIAFAAAGAGLAWLAWLGWIPEGAVRDLESEQIRFWRFCGLPVLLGLFLFTLSAGGWSGYIHTTDMNYMSLAGLVPHSDASGFYKDTFHLAYFGDWELMGSRRPLAEALRELTAVAAGYSYPGTLLVQLLLMGSALYLASYVFVQWYGIWPGIGFAGFAFNIARPYLATTLTEPLGYIWGLFSLICFVQSVRKSSLPHALLGLATLTVALLMRMGALFAIPFMVLWMSYAFGKGGVSRIRLIALACAVIVAVVVVNEALERFYSEEGVGTGNNFAWTTCGLSIGMNWDGCSRLYQAEIAKLPNERAEAKFLFAQTWKNFVAKPTLLFGQLWDNLSLFIRGLLGFMLAGYVPLFSIDPGEALLVILPLLVSACFFWRNASTVERSFWVAILASIPPSASILMIADGWRLLHVTHLFVAGFLALGFAAPHVITGRKTEPSWRWQPAAGVLAASLGILLIVPALARAASVRELQSHPQIPKAQPNVEIVTGGRRMSGFLVIPDDEARPRTVPALHASEFVKLIRWTRLEDDFGPFLGDVLPRVPFAFVGAGRMDGSNVTNIYIVSPEILRRRVVWAWRFATRPGPSNERPWTTLRDVVAAEPLP